MYKLALCCPMICLMMWPENSFAYRPFDSTDAAVADLGELEIELGPVEFRRSEAERTPDRARLRPQLRICQELGARGGGAGGASAAAGRGHPQQAGRQRRVPQGGAA